MLVRIGQWLTIQINNVHCRIRVLHKAVCAITPKSVQLITSPNQFQEQAIPTSNIEISPLVRVCHDTLDHIHHRLIDLRSAWRELNAR